MSTPSRKIILFGLPRSGTTWLSELLSCDNNFRLVHEPDNEANSFLGLVFKAGLHRYPYFNQTATDENYKKLFSLALNFTIHENSSIGNKLCFKLSGMNMQKVQENLSNYGTGYKNPSKLWEVMANTFVKGKKSNRDVIVKSVHGFLSIPFLIRALDFTPVFIFRNPLNIYSSYVTLNMPDQDRKLYDRHQLLEDFNIPSINPGERDAAFIAGYQIGGFYKVIQAYCDQFSSIVAIDYEDLMTSPEVKVPPIFDQLGIPYSKDTEKFMLSKFKRGAGYETNRTPENQLQVYKKRLSKNEIDSFIEGYRYAKGEVDFKIY
ncbi:MAG: sulfotransferase [Bacteroidota bacterium]